MCETGLLLDLHEVSKMAEWSEFVHVDIFPTLSYRENYFE